MEPAGAIFVFGKVACRAAVGRACDVDVKAEGRRIGALSGLGAEVSFTHMDGGVSCIAQELGQGVARAERAVSWGVAVAAFWIPLTFHRGG